MTPGTVMEIGRQAIEVTLLVSAPMLIDQILFTGVVNQLEQ